MCQQALLFCYRYHLISNFEISISASAQLSEDVQHYSRLLQLTDGYGSVRRILFESRIQEKYSKGSKSVTEQTNGVDLNYLISKTEVVIRRLLRSA
jgi:hypothetical protein